MEFINKYSGIFTFISMLLAIIGLIIAKFLGSEWYWYIVIVIVFLLAIFCAYLYGRSKAQKSESKVVSITDSFFTDTLLEYIKFLKDKGRTLEIIRWGCAVSRPLWLTHKYEIRKEIGELLEDAVSKKPEYYNEVLTKVLIDDIGWTNVELLEYKKAIPKIEEGIRIAKQHDNWYMIAKGNRHLFALYTRTDEDDDIDRPENINQFIDEADIDKPNSAINNITDEAKKNELTAECYFAKATFELKNKNFLAAQEHIEKAKEYYEKVGETKQIKILSREGDILLSLGKYEEAKQCFAKGLEQTKDEECHINKYHVRNLIGMGDYHEATCNLPKKLDDINKKRQEAKYNYEEAQRIATDVGMMYELKIARKKLEKYQ